MNDDKKPNTIRLYGLGGTGFNVSAQLENFRHHTIPATANLDIAYADTSDSDLFANPEIKPENCFFLPNAEGSGKFQGQHVDAIDAHTKAILQKFKPSSTMNILVSSLSGGSGWPYAYHLAAELLDTGHNVIIIGVGTTADKKEITNTRNAILAAKNLAKEVNRVVPFTYFQNSQATPRDVVDKAIVTLIGSLCVLYSGQNHGLDRQDLYNWLHFSENKTTSYGARMAQLGMFAGDEKIGNIGNVISVATLATAKSGHEISQTPEYQVVGRIPDNANQIIIDQAPIHFVLSTGLLDTVVAALDEKLADLKRARDAIVDTSAVASLPSDTKATRRGFVLED